MTRSNNDQTNGPNFNLCACVNSLLFYASVPTRREGMLLLFRILLLVFCMSMVGRYRCYFPPHPKSHATASAF
ncbi:hypothetical protein BCR43DRAFT_490075 [Syncephalastrum racemosum]|uniref:Uncharacterized protein n=1 Tax=Syncephalastrum racemosum TaxID=13706 RepID=A0A1X2HF89_SYNRA|nr:hypothetical protein BCR43DRAFT_490075 [Syncephalastrum racemosum]